MQNAKGKMKTVEDAEDAEGRLNAKSQEPRAKSQKPKAKS
jgi:hypothetical protein